MVALVGEEVAASIPLSSKNGGGMQSPIYINMAAQRLLKVMRIAVLFAECYHKRGDYVEVPPRTIAS